MNSFRVHLAFALISSACLGLVVNAALELAAARRVNRMMSEASGAQAAGAPTEARLAAAVRLARAGDVKGAEGAYRAVIQHGSPDLRRMAQYNLANMWTRQALAMTERDMQFLPLVEMAKQQYRDVLAEQPGHWDARYNLERVLWLVPEQDLLQAGTQTAAPAARTQRPIMLDPGDLP